MYNVDLWFVNYQLSSASSTSLLTDQEGYTENLTGEIAEARDNPQPKVQLVFLNMSRDMTKPTKWLCIQRRLRSAWASAQSDQSLRCSHETMGPQLPIEHTTKTLIRLGGCPGGSESLLGANSFCWFCHVPAQMFVLYS